MLPSLSTSTSLHHTWLGDRTKKGSMSGVSTSAGHSSSAMLDTVSRKPPPASIMSSERIRHSHHRVIDDGHLYVTPHRIITTAPMLNAPGWALVDIKLISWCYVCNKVVEFDTAKVSVMLELDINFTIEYSPTLTSSLLFNIQHNIAIVNNQTLLLSCFQVLYIWEQLQSTTLHTWNK